MEQFDFKKWLFENKAGAYGKASLNEAHSVEDAFADGNKNRGDMNEINPAALGMGQEEADIEMQKQDDLNGDMVDNASMDTVAEGDGGTTEVEVGEWEVNILGKDYIIDAEVTVDFHSEDADYEDHMEISPGGFYVDGATAVITSLGILDVDDYRDITDPVHIKQIQDLINKDPKLNRKLEDAAGNAVNWDKMYETVGWATITKPSTEE